MIFVLAVLGAVLSWAASRVAIRFGLPDNLAELAPFLAVLSACLWAIWHLEVGATRSQLWLAVAPMAWLGGGVIGSHLYVPGDEQLLWWLPSGFQSPATTTALASYLICVVPPTLRALARSVEQPKSSVSGGEPPAHDTPTLH